jgi:hypothetical protein
MDDPGETDINRIGGNGGNPDELEEPEEPEDELVDSSDINRGICPTNQQQPLSPWTLSVI